MELAGKTVLIVDDDKPVREILEKAFSIKQAKVISASNVLSALGLVREERIDAVITDYNMPGLSGIDLVKSFSKMDIDPVIVLITGEADEKLKKEAENAGITNILEKPFKLSQLFRILQSC